jgi:WD40 repeat protein
LDGLSGWALWVRFDPSGARLAVNRTNTVEVWDANTGNRLNSIPEQPGYWSAWSPDGLSLMVPSYNSYELLEYDSGTSDLQLRLSAHLLMPSFFEFSPRGHSGLSAADDHTMRWWDARTGQQLLVTVAATSPLKWSADGTQIAASTRQGQACIYDVSPAQVFREYQGQTAVRGKSLYLAASEDGRFVISGTFFALHLWDAQSGEESQLVPAGYNFPIVRAIFPPNSHDLLYGVAKRGVFRQSLSWTNQSPGGQNLVTLSETTALPDFTNLFVQQISSNGQAWLLNDANGQTQVWQPGHSPLLLPVQWPNGTLSSDGHWCAAVDGNGNATIWKIETGEVVMTIPDQKITALCFSPRGEWLIGSSLNGCRVWQTESWKLRASWPADYVPLDIRRLSCGGAGRVAAILVEPDTVGLLSLPEGRELIRLEAPFPLGADQVALSDDLSRVWLLASGARVFEWNLTALRRELTLLGLNWQ